jgi:hypothetical protein
VSAQEVMVAALAAYGPHPYPGTWADSAASEILVALAAAGYHVVRTMETVTEDGKRVRLTIPSTSERLYGERTLYRATEVES